LPVRLSDGGCSFQFGRTSLLLTPRSAYPSSHPQKTPNDVSTTRITKVASAARQAIVNVRLPEATFTAIVFRSDSAASVALSSWAGRRSCGLARRTWRKLRGCGSTEFQFRPDSSTHRSGLGAGRHCLAASHYALAASLRGYLNFFRRYLYSAPCPALRSHSREDLNILVRFLPSQIDVLIGKDDDHPLFDIHDQKFLTFVLA
jgi:hypothetical protein